jgi:glycosyltransferase involved in cell wall biosynthesis
MPLISIITTVYNSENYIVECLNTIQNQTFSNFEHIIINDGSIDNTKDIIENYIFNNNYNNIKLINSSKIGRAKALDLAINHAITDIICIIDADDLWDSNKLLIQYNYFTKYNLDLLCTSTSLFKNSQDIDNKIVNINTSYSENILKKITLKKLLFKNLISHSSVMIKKQFCSYNTDMKSQIDYELWLRLLSKNNNLKFSFLDLKLNYHRIHKNQNFENKGFLYKYNAVKITNKYAIRNGYFDVIFFNILKIPYYSISRLLNILNSNFS